MHWAENKGVLMAFLWLTQSLLCFPPFPLCSYTAQSSAKLFMAWAAYSKCSQPSALTQRQQSSSGKIAFLFIMRCSDNSCQWKCYSIFTKKETVMFSRTALTGVQHHPVWGIFCWLVTMLLLFCFVSFYSHHFFYSLIKSTTTPWGLHWSVLNVNVM